MLLQTYESNVRVCSNSTQDPHGHAEMSRLHKTLHSKLIQHDIKLQGLFIFGRQTILTMTEGFYQLSDLDMYNLLHAC